jgi:glycolate oxidase
MSNVDRALAALARVLPSDAVSTDVRAREEAAADDWTRSERLPDAVIVARSTDEISTALRIAYEHDVPTTPRAGGTGRTGGAVPTRGGFVLSMEGLARIRGIEQDDGLAVVEPGVVLGDLHDAVDAEGLFYPPDPNSWASCQLGGNLAENAAGPRAYKYGATRDYVLGTECVLADGTVLRTGRRTRKGVTGYDVTSLLVGSEGTLAVFTEAVLRLLPRPERTVSLLAPFESVEAAARAVVALAQRTTSLTCLEMLDEHTLDLVREKAGLVNPNARALLIADIDGDETFVDGELERVGGWLTGDGALDVLVARTHAERERVWAPRRALSYALRTLAAHKLSEDVVVPRSKIPALLAAVREISERERVLMPAYGHAGDGNFHVNLLWNDGEKPRVDAAIDALLRTTVELGGTLSGEHGIGLAKAPYLHYEQSNALIGLQRSLKSTFDPKGLLNPDKIFGGGPHKGC